MWVERDWQISDLALGSYGNSLSLTSKPSAPLPSPLLYLKIDVYLSLTLFYQVVEHFYHIS
jgi:hypothetical protein